MAFIKRKYIWWGIALVFFWMLCKSITPPGRDPVHAESSALAMRGRNLHAYMQRIIETKGGFTFAEHGSSDGLLRKLLEGAPELEGLAFDEEGCLWNVFARGHRIDVTDLPIFISANFNPSAIGRKDGNEHLPIGVTSGASRSMLQDRAIVVVRNDGDAQVIKAERLTRRTLLRGATNGFGRIEVLTPHGRETVNFGNEDERKIRP